MVFYFKKVYSLTHCVCKNEMDLMVFDQQAFLIYYTNLLKLEFLKFLKTQFIRVIETFKKISQIN